MLHFQILTIFPELFGDFQRHGLISRALDQQQIKISTIHLRDFALNTYGQVDDTPYGGGSGMVLRPEPAVAAIEQAKKLAPNAKVILFTPRGTPLTQELAKELALAAPAKPPAATEAGMAADDAAGGYIFLCCRYEGVDQRIADHWVDLEISIGDYVLMGGEVAAMAVIEAVARLLPGVLNNPESIRSESFEQGLLEYPQFTKPSEFRGHKVPEILLSGNHQAIANWRAEQSRTETAKRRPDLIGNQSAKSAPIETTEKTGSAPLTCELSVALIHYPVMGKKGEIITSSITNLDLHDIARSARTFGLTRYYVVHPGRTLRRLAERICEHWSTGYGFRYNPNRSTALETITIVPDFDDVLMDIESRTGQLPKIITTSARPGKAAVTFPEMDQELRRSTAPHLLLLGTGWGLAPEMLDRSDFHLEPIVGPSEYNHLSVRAAAAIMFDRLINPRP